MGAWSRLRLGGGNVTFADSIVDYEPGKGVGPPYDDPETSLGVPDSGRRVEKYVSLGINGSLVLQFAGKGIMPAGDFGSDLWVYEFKSEFSRRGRNSYEPVRVQISEDGNRWTDVGATMRFLGGIDIDAYVGKGVDLSGSYQYVCLIDQDNDVREASSGADIDAVAAIGSTPRDSAP